MNVPTNLVQTRITELPEYGGSDPAGSIPYAFEGRTYKVQFSQLVGLNLYNDPPKALGIVSPGFSNLPARGDHIHPALDLSNPIESTGVLPPDKGGTGDAIVPDEGGIAYSTATGLAVSLPGSAGLPLLSGGLGAPTFGVLPVEGGGTGQVSYDAGDIIVATASTTLSGVGSVAAGNVLLSNGLGAVPVYGKVGLTTHVSGVLPVDSGGTGATTLTGYVKGNGAGPFSASATIPMADVTGLGTMASQNANTVAITGGTAALTSLSTTGGVTVGGALGVTGAATLGGAVTLSGLTGYVKANGASPVTASATVPGSDVSGNISGNAANVTGIVDGTHGGTGQTTYTNGQLLIGNAAGGLSKATLTQGTGITITNGNGTITIALTGGAGTVTSVDGSGGATGLTFTGGPITGAGTLTLGGALNLASGGTGRTSAMTTGSVVFAGAGGALAEDNAHLFWDNTNDRLGIGTAAPASELDITRSAAGGIVRAQVSNSATGASTFARYDLSTGTANSYVLSFLNDNAGAPSYQLSCGLAVTQAIYDFPIHVWRTNASERMRIDANSLAVGSATTVAGTRVRVGGNLTGSTSGIGVQVIPTFQSDVTALGAGFSTNLATVAAAYTLSQMRHFVANQGTIGAGSTVNNQAGFYASSNMVGASNNYAFYGDIPAATGRWNFFANGTANNAFAGNVRIGSTVAPTVALDVTGNIAATGSVSGSTLQVDANFYSQISVSNPIINFDATDYLAFTRSTNTFNFNVGNAQKLTVDANGAAVTGDLSASGTFTAGGTIYRESQFYLHMSGSNPYINFDSGDYMIYDRAANNLQFQFNGAQRAVVDSNGVTSSRFTIDSTFWHQLTGGNPQFAVDNNDYWNYDRTANYFSWVIGGAFKFHVNAAGARAVGDFTVDNALSAAGLTTNTGTTGNWNIVNHHASTVNGYELFYNNGAVVGSVTCVGSTGVAYNTTSDRRLKMNIEPAAPVGAVLDQIDVVQFDWTLDGSHEPYGVVAQDLFNLVPGAVHQGNDADGGDIDDPWMVDYSKLVPMLLAEIKDLRARAASAEERLAALEAL